MTARDRGLLLQLGRGPARVAVADVPGIDAFWLVTSGQSFVPSAATEELVTDQQKLLVETYGDKGREIIADAQAEADGINAYRTANNINQPPATVNDVIAVTAFIGSIFGAGGGGEAANAELLSKLQHQLGAVKGHKAWDDAMLSDDPRRRPRSTSASTTRSSPAAPVTGSVGRSIRRLGASSDSTRPCPPRRNAAARPPSRPQAGLELPASPRPGARPPATRLAVMGPQLGYYYPEIVEQMHLHGPASRPRASASRASRCTS